MSKEKAMTKTNQALTAPTYGSEWDDPADEFIGPKIPILKAIQSGTENAPDGVKDGAFFNTATGYVYENPLALMLHVGKPRMANYQPYTPGVKKPLLCSSSDGITPDGGIQMQPGPCRKCVGGRWVEVCPLAKWDGDNPPKCSTLYSALFWILGSEDAVVHTFKRTSMKALRTVLTQRKALMQELLDKDNPDVHPKFLVPVKLHTEKKANYYEVKMDLVTDANSRVPADYARNVMEMTRGFVDQLNQMSTEEITETKVDDSDSFVPPEEPPY